MSIQKEGEEYTQDEKPLLASRAQPRGLTGALQRTFPDFSLYRNLQPCPDSESNLVKPHKKMASKLRSFLNWPGVGLHSPLDSSNIVQDSSSVV
jgi:hypothetical protein